YLARFRCLVEVAEIPPLIFTIHPNPPFTAINRRDCLRASAKVASDLCTRLLQQLIRRANNSKKKFGALPLFDGGGGDSATYTYNPSKPPFTAINRRDCLRASTKVASDLCTRLLQQLKRDAYNSKKQCGALFPSVEVAD
ncbi:MAG: hypothetical protein IJ478_07200, partial [Alistipes sp.]|nr:hypothetical protein [Alistipes sp.]